MRDTGSQMVFSPMHYGFRWTEDWYEFDSAEAHRVAKQRRDAAAKELKAQGKVVKKFTLRGQLVSRGGIGSGHPHIEQIVTVYGLNYH